MKPMKNQPESNALYSNGEKAILEAAETLSAKNGFDAVSMSAIAKLANTSKPNIYHHFKNKNELYLAVMKTAVRRSSMLLDALENKPGTFTQHLTDFSSGQLDNILSHSRSTQLILRETLSGSSQHGQEIAMHVVGEVFTRLVVVIHQGQQEKEFRDNIDPALAAFMVVAANMFYFQASPIMNQIPETHLTNDPATYSDGIIDIILNGVLQQGENR